MAAKELNLKPDGLINPRKSGRKRVEMDKVIVTDINMKFTSMVKFMIKWALASIPAMVVLLLFAALVFTISGSISIIFK